MPKFIAISIDKIRRRSELLVKPLQLPICCAALAAYSWNLTIAYILICPVLALWLIARASSLKEHLVQTRSASVPFLFLIATLLLSSLVGVDPARSLKAIPATLFFACSVLLIRDTALKHGPLQLLSALVFGQAIAALDTILQSAFPETIPHLFLGAVTQSGQIAIVIMLATGLGFSLLQGKDTKKPDRDLSLAEWILVGASSACLVLMMYLPARSGHSVVYWLATAIGLATTIPSLGLALKELLQPAYYWQSLSEPQARKFARYLLRGFIPLLLAALIANLKRGPWMGVFVAGSILLLICKPKLLLPLLLGVAISYFSIEPVRQRIAEIPEHFYISGGRSVMWDIGVELSTRFPLGVGLRNSRFLQSFSPEIPKDLNHFHNNYINVVVEGGWLGLACFVWWIVALLELSFRPLRAEITEGLPLATSPRPLLVGIGCAIVAWQIAGLVEYNWGDSEVRMMIYAMLGILLSLTREEFSKTPARST